MLFLINKRSIQFVILLTFSLSVFTLISSCKKPEKPAFEQPKRTFAPGPIIDSSIKRKTFKKEIEGIEDPDMLAHLGDKYFESKRYEQAIEAYKKTLRLNPDDVDTYNDLGLALHYTGSSDKAIDILKKGTEVDPSYQRIWLSLGFVLTVTGNKEEAKTALQRAIEIDPNSAPGKETERLLRLLE